MQLMWNPFGEWHVPTSFACPQLRGKKWLAPSSQYRNCRTYQHTTLVRHRACRQTWRFEEITMVVTADAAQAQHNTQGRNHVFTGSEGQPSDVTELKSSWFRPPLERRQVGCDARILAAGLVKYIGVVGWSRVIGGYFFVTALVTSGFTVEISVEVAGRRLVECIGLLSRRRWSCTQSSAQRPNYMHACRRTKARAGAPWACRTLWKLTVCIYVTRASKRLLGSVLDVVFCLKVNLT